ncbi:MULTISPECIES: hypothetical protein [Capnocytophaga]|uniref:hypothetical protein n=1 Tax=Capnocytophaga TaxID=1016 RepID=UPI000BB1F08B|nr:MULTISPECIES: hypothetical protein [Capnocytophaga]ATA74919.1 hypothetical protein CGC52_05480 [Capnocytophaga sp. H2931]AWL79348.1 hypothetical protein DKB58_10570 [Capnocytophaga canimorsus]AYW35923.1 hypothetical protein D8L92_00250 [Capnocytophaga canimorsus]MDT9498804.1 hypothetical protein [Capnocytophaga canimorsus]GJQ03611.1 hypothetical protein CAPN009_00260 [Capnocytophaga canimorsus]
MNNEAKPLDKEAKILLLKILKQGYISPENLKELEQKIHLPSLRIEVIDKREQVQPDYIER